MPLSYALTQPKEGATWDQSEAAQGRHVARISVTGFTSSNYYDMVAELYADPNRPAFGDPPGPQPELSFFRLRQWSIVEVLCGAPIPEIFLQLTYTTQSQIFSGGGNPDADGPVVFRQRSIQLQETVDVDINDMPLVVIYKTDTQSKQGNRQKSRMIYEIERYEDENPEPRVNGIIDKVNDSLWNGRARYTTQLIGFQSDTRDEGSTYFCFYTFLYDQDGLDPLFRWTNPDGSLPNGSINNPLEPNAQVRYETIETADFGPLNINIPNP